MQSTQRAATHGSQSPSRFDANHWRGQVCRFDGSELTPGPGNYWRTFDRIDDGDSASYGDFTPDGAASANSAMQVALSTILRLFAPYLPFVTEEVWSWWRPGSIHQAAWPTSDEVIAPIGGDDAAASNVFLQSQLALAEIRRLKALAKKPVKAVIDRAVLPAAFESLRPAARDFQAAAHIRELVFADVAEPDLTFAEEPVA